MMDVSEGKRGRNLSRNRDAGDFVIPSILSVAALMERERSALQARFQAEKSGMPEDYERAADLFDELHYTAGSVLRRMAELRRNGKRPRLHVASSGLYTIQEG